MPTVAIVRGENPHTLVSCAIDLLGGPSRFAAPEEKILLKPNLCGGVPGKTGTFVNPEVLCATIKTLGGRAGTILVGEADSCMYEADVMLEKTGARMIAQDEGAQVVNLSRGDMTALEDTGAYVLKRFELHRAIAEADGVVSLAVMKTHACSDVTLCMKSMFGALPERKKSKYHPKLDHVIADISAFLKPRLNIVDATVGLEGYGPFKGEQVKLDLLIAGDNIVATDACAATIMGFDPTAIPHLKLASERGAGPIDLTEIEVRGERLEDVKREFKRAPQEKKDRVLCRISPTLGYYTFHQHYVSAVKSHEREMANK